MPARFVTLLAKRLAVRMEWLVRSSTYIGTMVEVKHEENSSTGT